MSNDPGYGAMVLEDRPSPICKRRSGTVRGRPRSMRGRRSLDACGDLWDRLVQKKRRMQGRISRWAHNATSREDIADFTGQASQRSRG
jgi:hypothetical protein